MVIGLKHVRVSIGTYNTVHNILELGVFYIYVNVPRPSPPITMLFMPGMGVFRSNIVSGVREGGEAISRLKIYQISLLFSQFQILCTGL